MKTWKEIRASRPTTPEREAETARWVAVELERLNQQSSKVGATAEAGDEEET